MGGKISQKHFQSRKLIIYLNATEIQKKFKIHILNRGDNSIKKYSTNKTIICYKYIKVH